MKSRFCVLTRGTVYTAYTKNEQAQKNLQTATENLTAAEDNLATAQDEVVRTGQDIIDAEAALVDAQKKEQKALYDTYVAAHNDADAYDNLKDAVVDAWNQGVYSSEEAREAISEAMAGMSDAARETFTEDLPEDLKYGLNPDHYASVGDKMGEWFKNTANKMIQGFKDIFGIASPSKVMADMGGNILDGLLNGLKTAVDSVSRVFSDVWKGIKDVFADVGTWFQEKFQGAVDNVKTVWEGISTWFTENVIDPVKEGFRGFVNGLIGFFESFANGFVKAINALIGALNKINIDIPGWLQTTTGMSSFGFNLSKVSEIKIPRLAKGGIVDSATVAMIGERGREAVMPLEHNTEWIDTLADKVSARIGGNQEVAALLRELIEVTKAGHVITVNEQVIADTTSRGQNKLARQYGRSPVPT